MCNREPNDWSVGLKFKGGWMPFPEWCEQGDVTMCSVVCL